MEALDEDTTNQVKTSILTSSKVFEKNLKIMVAQIVNLEDEIFGLEEGARHATRTTTIWGLHTPRPWVGGTPARVLGKETQDSLRKSGYPPVS